MALKCLLIFIFFILCPRHLVFFKVAGFSSVARCGSLQGGGSSHRPHSTGGSGRTSGMETLRLQGLLLADTSEGELLGMSKGFSPGISLPDITEHEELGGWSLGSTSFVDVSGSREQHGVGAESTAASESGLGGGRTSPAGLDELLSCSTWPSEEELVEAS